MAIVEDDVHVHSSHATEWSSVQSCVQLLATRWTHGEAKEMAQKKGSLCASWTHASRHTMPCLPGHQYLSTLSVASRNKPSRCPSSADPWRSRLSLPANPIHIHGPPQLNYSWRLYKLLSRAQRSFLPVSPTDRQKHSSSCSWLLAACRPDCLQLHPISLLGSLLPLDMTYSSFSSDRYMILVSP
jgi:hypothetical protein